MQVSKKLIKLAIIILVTNLIIASVVFLASRPDTTHQETGALKYTNTSVYNKTSVTMHEKWVEINETVPITVVEKKVEVIYHPSSQYPARYALMQERPYGRDDNFQGLPIYFLDVPHYTNGNLYYFMLYFNDSRAWCVSAEFYNSTPIGFNSTRPAGQKLVAYVYNETIVEGYEYMGTSTGNPFVGVSGWVTLRVFNRIYELPTEEHATGDPQ